MKTATPLRVAAAVGTKVMMKKQMATAMGTVDAVPTNPKLRLLRNLQK